MSSRGGRGLGKDPPARLKRDGAPDREVPGAGDSAKGDLSLFLKHSSVESRLGGKEGTILEENPLWRIPLLRGVLRRGNVRGGPGRRESDFHYFREGKFAGMGGKRLLITYGRT